MRRCIELASKNVGYTYPNPLVGSVIVCDNKVIGEGSHAKYGESHAEVNAINSVKDKSIYIEEYARGMIKSEEVHSLEIRKMLIDFS